LQAVDQITSVIFVLAAGAFSTWATARAFRKGRARRGSSVGSDTRGPSRRAKWLLLAFDDRCWGLSLKELVNVGQQADVKADAKLRRVIAILGKKQIFTVNESPLGGAFDGAGALRGGFPHPRLAPKWQP
jgi:hypothetical protein